MQPPTTDAVGQPSFWWAGKAPLLAFNPKAFPQFGSSPPAPKRS